MTFPSSSSRVTACASSSSLCIDKRGRRERGRWDDGERGKGEEGGREREGPPSSVFFFLFSPPPPWDGIEKESCGSPVVCKVGKKKWEGGGWPTRDCPVVWPKRATGEETGKIAVEKRTVRENVVNYILVKVDLSRLF